MIQYERYLTEDVTGSASRIEYGKKGDKVLVLDDEREMILVENGPHRFFVRKEQLSPLPVKKDPVTVTDSTSTPRKSPKKKK